MALLSLGIGVMNSLLSPALTCKTDSRNTLRPLVTASVVAGRENNILSCSSTARCSAAEMAENFFFFLGEVLAVTLIYAPLNHGYIISQMLRKLWIYIPPF